MNGVAGQRDARADIHAAGFVEFDHILPTHRRAASCRTRLSPPLLALCVLVLGGCAGDLSALDPAGPAAARIATLWWAMLTGAAVILAGVMGFALYALKRRRGMRQISERRVLIGWGLAFPVLTLLTLMAFAFAGGESLSARADAERGIIGAQARQWEWTFVYPGGQRTHDVLHVPAGQDFTLALTSGDVIHSFWVPRLGGKMDAIPGKVNHIRLRADRPGTYSGVCAEYCGIGHAHMPFEVRAHRPADYAAALASASPAAPADKPVLRKRDAPASTVIARWTDYLFDWLEGE